jgi:hypothetical protein
MSIVTEKEAARARGREGNGATPGSIREVSLVGRPPRRWAEGDRVSWAGRPYRVVGESGRYAYLRPEPTA